MLCRLLDHAGGRLLDLSERGEKGGEEEKKDEKREGKEGKKGRKGRPLLDYYYPHALAEDQEVVLPFHFHIIFVDSCSSPVKRLLSWATCTKIVWQLMTLVTLLMTNNYITLATLFWCAIIIIFVTHTNIVELIIADTTYPAVIIHFTKFAINCFVPHWVFRYLNIKLTYSCWTSALTVFICKTSVPSTFLASLTCSLLLVFPATSFVYFCSWCCDRNISNTSSNCGVLLLSQCLRLRIRKRS